VAFGDSGPAAIRWIKDRFFRAALQSRPKPDKKTCIGCRKCANICPAKAITMRDKLPVIDRRKCIGCFCCQEFCTNGAMKVHRPFIAGLIAKIQR
jgi:formate hydrogenlyase subunit 6/NADH:ubiquinone oxidoreductase subunit I